MTPPPVPPRTPDDRSPFVLAATMLRVAVAEITDSGRLMRGRRLNDDGAVGALTTAAGLITASVHGSDPTPYVVHWRAAPLSAEVERQRRRLPSDHARRATMLVPSAADLSPSCTCVDAATSAGFSACKHAVAVVQALADAVEHDAAQLAHWRGVVLDAEGDVDPDDPALDHRPADDVDRPVGASLGGEGRSGPSRIDGRHGVQSAPVDPLADLLSFPAGGRLPAGRFVIAPLDAPVPDDDDPYAVVLADALEWMRHVSPW